MRFCSLVVGLCALALGVAALDPSRWMQDTLDTIGNRTLRQVALVGSHDAGMSELTWRTLFVSAYNTKTQTHTVLGQLRNGARYFDLRPSLSHHAGQYHAGHYSPAILGQWVGADGRSFDDVVDDINNFTAERAELVVLRLGHAWSALPHPKPAGDAAHAVVAPAADGSSGGREISFHGMNQTEWEDLMARMSRLKHLYVADPSTDVLGVPVGKFIGAGQAAVVVLVESDTGAVDLGRFEGRGFFHMPETYDNYANSGSLDKMAEDQLRKMRDNCGRPKWFLLSWTLTQGILEMAEGKSILLLAGKANAALKERVLPAVTPRCYPNIVHIDDVSSGVAAEVVVAINNQVAV